MATDYCHYKPVVIQAHGVKCNYSEVTLELNNNRDTFAEDACNVVAVAKTENGTFKNKLNNWLKMPSNSGRKSDPSRLENSTTSPPKTNAAAESIRKLFYRCCSIPTTFKIGF